MGLFLASAFTRHSMSYDIHGTTFRDSNAVGVSCCSPKRSVNVAILAGSNCLLAVLIPGEFF